MSKGFTGVSDPLKPSFASTNTVGPLNVNSGRGTVLHYGFYIGIVKNVIDPSMMGRVFVFIPEISGSDENNANSWIPMSYVSPFFNTTTPGKGQLAPQQSSGFYATPRDIGISLLCGFVNGDLNKGFYIGCIPEAFQNKDVAGTAPAGTTAGGGNPTPPQGSNSGSSTTDQPTAKQASGIPNPTSGPKDSPSTDTTGRGANPQDKEQIAKGNDPLNKMIGPPEDPPPINDQQILNSMISTQELPEQNNPVFSKENNINIMQQINLNNNGFLGNPGLPGLTSG